LVEKHRDILRFLKGLIHLRSGSAGRKRDPQQTLHQLLRASTIRWHGLKLDQPGWEPDSRILSVTLGLPEGDYLGQLMVNAYWEDLDFELPPPPGGPEEPWLRLVDTALDPPHDIALPNGVSEVRGPTYRVLARSFVFLVAKKG
jgi:glycogen operon protein